MTDPTTPLPCPHCRQAMETETIGEVEIDICSTHGVWLDAGELEAIVLQRRELDEARRIQLSKQRRRNSRRRRERREAKERWDRSVSLLLLNMQ